MLLRLLPAPPKATIGITCPCMYIIQSCWMHVWGHPTPASPIGIGFADWFPSKSLLDRWAGCYIAPNRRLQGHQTEHMLPSKAQTRPRKFDNTDNILVDGGNYELDGSRILDTIGAQITSKGMTLAKFDCPASTEWELQRWSGWGNQLQDVRGGRQSQHAEVSDLARHINLSTRSKQRRVLLFRGPW